MNQGVNCDFLQQLAASMQSVCNKLLGFGIALASK